VVVSGLYTLPFGKGQRFLNHGAASILLGGWQVNSVFSASSGFPVEILDGINQSNTRLSNNRPNAVYGVDANAGPQTTQEWFNISAFQLQPFGSYGNVGRNTILGPGVVAWDFSTFKNFVFAERKQVQFRFECFNCANHPVWGDPGYTLAGNRLDANGVPIVGTGSFGTITSTRPGIDMRELQFGLKLMF
jgi:hypothetical protein